MHADLQQRVAALLSQFDTAALATCGPAGGQLSFVPYAVQDLLLELFLPPGSDHLFNLETAPRIALLTAGWRLSGKGTVLPAHNSTTRQQAVIVQISRLHILNQQNQTETIDF
jgi:hypothetical protein